MLTIISINTWKCAGDYTQRMEVLAKQLNALNPDIVALQEAFATKEENYHSAHLLSNRCNMEYEYVPAREKTRKLEGKEYTSYSGLAVLSRWPIKKHFFTDLPTNKKDGGRRAQYAVISYYSKELLLINCHLTFLQQAADLRNKQLTNILKNSGSATHYYAKIICGDFNAPIEADELTPFFEKPYSLIDSYRAGKGKHPAYTIKFTKNGETHASKIDHILSIPLSNGGHPEFKQSAIVLNKIDPYYGIFPSDHFGVQTVCDLH